MKLAAPFFSTVLEFKENTFTGLAVESRQCWRELLQDLCTQAEGGTGRSVLSKNNVPVNAAKAMELVLQPFPFDINRKSLVTKISAVMEKKGAQQEHFAATQALLAAAESHLFTLAEDLPAEIVFEKLSLGALIKVAGPAVQPASGDPLEVLLDFMALVTALEGEKLFVFAGMRACFETEELVPFIQTALAHKYRMLWIDPFAAPVLKGEQRLTIDADRCEF